MTKRLIKEIELYEKREEHYRQQLRICSCGRRQYLFHSQERTICNWCGHWIYKDEKTKFKYEMKSRLMK